MKHAVWLCAVLAVVATAVPVSATEVDRKRVNRFISVLEDNNCRMNRTSPGRKLWGDLRNNDFDKEEVREIAKALIGRDRAVVQGDYLVLRTPGCPS